MLEEYDFQTLVKLDEQYVNILPFSVALHPMRLLLLAIFYHTRSSSIRSTFDLVGNLNII